MSGNSYAPKVPMTDDEIQRWKPVCADFVSFRAGVRAAERAYNVGDLVRQANHYMDEWSNVCNENQRMLNRIASLEAERDQLRAEVERLRPNARRYEWLRVQPNNTEAPRIDVVQWTPQEDGSANDGEGLRLEELDTAIDRAIEAAKDAP